MANKNEIKARLSLEGEQAFKKAMKDAWSVLKELNSEEKVAAAQFKATGDAETYQAERARILKEKIEEQRKIVERTREELEKMTKDGVDPASTKYLTMQSQLNLATARLTEMQTELRGTNTVMGESQEAAGNLNESLKSIDSGVKLQGAIDAIDRVTERIRNIAKIAYRVMKETWNVMGDAGDWADELATTATQYGIDQKTLQQWRFASTQIDADVDAIAGARLKLTQNMGSTSEETIKAFNSLGVATKDSTGRMRDSQTVFWETIDAFHALEGAEDAAINTTERDQIAQRIFGRSYRELLPLINAGSEAYKEMADSAPVVSDEALERLTSFDDEMERLKATMDAAKYETLSNLAPSFERIATSMTTVVQKFNEFTQSEEGQAALKRVGDAVDQIFTAITDEVDFETMVDGAANAVERLGSSLEWLAEHKDGVIGAIKGITLAYGGLKAVSAGLTFAQMIRGIRLPRFGGGASAAVETGTEVGTGAVGARHNVLTNAFKRFGAGVSSKVASSTGLTLGGAFGTVLAGVTAGNLVGILGERAYINQTFGEANAALGAAETTIEAARETGGIVERLGRMFETMTPLYDELTGENIKTLYEYINENRAALEEALGHSIDELDSANWTNYNPIEASKIIADLYADLYAAISEKVTENVKTANLSPDDYAMQRNMRDQLSRILANWDNSDYYHGSAGAEALFLDTFKRQPGWGDWMSQSYGGDWENIISGPSMRDGLERVVEDLETEMTNAGLDATTGFTTAISDGVEGAATAAGDLAQAVPDKARDVLDSHSPSLVMRGIGEDAAIGLANGLTAQSGAVAAAAAALASIVAATVRGALWIHSPSRIMEGLGENVGAGFALGIDASVGRVDRAVGHMIDAVTGAPVSAGSGMAAMSAAGQKINAYIVMDREIVGEMVAPVVDGWLGAEIVERR